MLGVGDREAGPIRRPQRSVEHPRRELGEPALRALAPRPHRDLLGAVRFGDIGEAASVGRPRWVLVIHRWARGQIEHRPTSRRDTEDITVGRDQGRIAGRRQGVVHGPGDVLRPCLAADGHRPRRSARLVVGNIDDDLVQALGRQVHRPESATLLEGDAGAAAARPVDVIVSETSDLMARPRVKVVAPEVGAEPSAAIGQEIDAPPRPHRCGVGALPLGNALQPARGEVIDEHVLCLTTEIAFARGEVGEGLSVGDRVTVLREAEQTRLLQR